MEWATIHKTKSCQVNKEGISVLGSSTETSLDSCKTACEAQLDCAAIDYYETTKWCNFYDEACSMPLMEQDTASSHRIVRAKAVAEKTQAKRSTGFSIAEESSSAVKI